MILIYWFMACLVAFGGEENTDSTGLPQTIREAVVLIYTGSTMCSGTVDDSGRQVLTAYHCVASGGRPVVRTRGGKRVRGRVLRVDVAHDMAVLSLEEPLESGLAVSRTQASLGEHVFVVGHPFAVMAPGGFMRGTLRWSLSDGIVSAVEIALFRSAHLLIRKFWRTRCR